MTTIQMRRGSAAQWASANPVLNPGEFGIELDTGQMKTGNGTAAWTALPYAAAVGPPGPAGPAGPAGASAAVSVTAFGAVGDGVTDNTAAITAAIAAVSAGISPTNPWGQSGTVSFPAGTFVTGPLVLPERVALVGAGFGTTLQLKANAGLLANLITNQQNYAGSNDAQATSVRNMRLDGNRGSQLANSWNCAIVFSNDTPSGNYEYNDGRHQASNLLIQYFTGDGLVAVGNGVTQVSNVQVWQCNGFGFIFNVDNEVTNCDAGGCGIDGFWLQSNSQLANCKAWFCGNALSTNRFAGSPGAAASVTAPNNPWDNGGAALTYSLANGFGNGFLVGQPASGALQGNNSGAMMIGCSAQDNARAGYNLIGGRIVCDGCQADSNSNCGTSTGASTGTPVGSFPGFDVNASNCRITGLSWDRGANLNHQAAALRLAAGTPTGQIELQFLGSLNDGSNMPPLQAGSSTQSADLRMSVSNGGYQAATYFANYTPDPFQAETFAWTLTGPITIGNPALGGTNTTGIFLYAGQRLRLIFKQDATGGRVITLGSAFKTVASFSIPTTASSVSVVEFVYDGSFWRQASAVTTMAS